MNVAEEIGIARADWPQIGDIVGNHDELCPPAIDALDGLNTFLGGDIRANLIFRPGVYSWRDSQESLELEYRAFALGHQLFLVDGIPLGSNSRSVTMILDLAGMRALVVDVTFPTPEQAQTAVLTRLANTKSQSAVAVRYRQSGLGDASAAPFARTRALIGKHLRYTYSSTHVYDHIYVSERFYAWFCREGPDKDLGDFEECDYFELGERLYLVSWREKLLPCVGIMVENHATMRLSGKMCGVDAYTGKLGNTRVGATFRLIADCASTE
jgi:hypothetical protein